MNQTAIITMHDGKTRDIPALSVQTAQITISSAGKPQSETIKASTKDDKKVLVNNKDVETVAFSEAGDQVLLILTEKVEEEMHTYYINLEVSNNAGKKVTLVWSENDSPKTQDIENGERTNLSKIITTPEKELPSYDFQVHEFGSTNDLLINGQNVFTLTPSADPTEITYIAITSAREY